MLEDPSLIQNRLDRRLAARTADPARQRKRPAPRGGPDPQEHRPIADRLSGRASLRLDELRRRMPELRQQEHALQTELAILDQVND